MPIHPEKGSVSGRIERSPDSTLHAFRRFRVHGEGIPPPPRPDGSTGRNDREGIIPIKRAKRNPFSVIPTEGMQRNPFSVIPTE